MSVRTSADDRCRHPGTKGGENSSERHVKQSAFEISKVHTVIVLAIALILVSDGHAYWNSSCTFRYREKGYGYHSISMRTLDRIVRVTN